MAFRTSKRSKKSMGIKKRRTRRNATKSKKYRTKAGGGTRDTGRDRATRSRLDYGAPVYVPGKKSQFYITAESTGMQLKKLGVFRAPNYSPRPIESIGSYTYHNINQWVVQSSQGFQNVDYGECIFTRDQLIGNISNSRLTRYQWHDDPYLLNPWSNRPTNTIYPVVQPANTVARNDVLYIKNVKIRMEMLNMTLLPQNMKIYFLTPNYDTNVNPIDQWGAIIDAKNAGQNAAVHADDLLDVVATAGQQSTTDPRNSPFIHTEFRNNWTTLTSQNVVLQAGEQVNFEFTIEYNKAIHRETVLTNRPSQFLRGLTIFPMLITNAGLAAIAATEATEALEVSYGEVKVGFVSNHTITFGALPVSRKSFNRIFPGTIRDAAAGTVAEAQKVFGDDDNVKLANTRL